MMGYLFEAPSGVSSFSFDFRAILSDRGLCGSPEEVVEARAAAMAAKRPSPSEKKAAATFEARRDALLSRIPMS